MSNGIIVPACYFGPIDLYRNIHQASIVTVDIGEHFVRKSPRVRMDICGANGRQTLSMHVARTHEKTPMHQMQLSFVEDWRKEHWHAIKSAYGQSAFFIHYADQVKELVLSDEPSLYERNIASMHSVLKMIKLQCEIDITEKYQQAEDSVDHRSTFGKGKFRDPALNELAQYRQVFAERHGFQRHLGILDLIFNMGPETGRILST